MTDFLIRPYRAQDRSDLLALWHDGWHDAHAALVPQEILALRTPDRFAEWLDGATDTFLVAADPGLLGFCSVDGDELVKLYVSASARGGRVARALMGRAEALIAANGLATARLLCTDGNLRAQRFYEREGWRLVRIFADRLWTPDPTVPGPLVPTRLYGKDLGTPPQDDAI